MLHFTCQLKCCRVQAERHQLAVDRGALLGWEAVQVGPRTRAPLVHSLVRPRWAACVAATLHGLRGWRWRRLTALSHTCAAVPLPSTRCCPLAVHTLLSPCRPTRCCPLACNMHRAPSSWHGSGARAACSPPLCQPSSTLDSLQLALPCPPPARSTTSIHACSSWESAAAPLSMWQWPAPKRCSLRRCQPRWP